MTDRSGSQSIGGKLQSALAAKDSPPPLDAPRAAYVHVPFCAHRCGYCNFTLVAGRSDLVPAYLDALKRELSAFVKPREVDTLFLGGGTPTQLSPDELRQLFDVVHRWVPPPSSMDDAKENGAKENGAKEDGRSSRPSGYREFTIEANPADLNAENAAVLRNSGVTRISLGAQSLDAATLQLLERDHSPRDVARAFELAQGVARSVSVDLIFAAPGQTLSDWERELDAALALGPDHVSTYGLTYEQGTSFWSRLRKNKLREVPDELQREMYLLAIDKLTAAGFEHYEVSNFARPGHRCRHNEVYWRGEGYFAAGPGAARYVAGERSVNHRSVFTWMRRLQAGTSPVAERERLSPEDRARELLVLSLRRVEGLNCREFQQRTGFAACGLLANVLPTWRSLQLIGESDDRLWLTRRGLLVSDSMWGDVLKA